MADEASFGKFRSLVWPVHKGELLKFLPTLLLFFLVCFNYHLLKIVKDPLIITAPGSGAEVIPFLKVWAILPSAIAMTFLYTSLSNRFNRENIFYVMTFIFIAFFALFIFVLYPNGDKLYLDSAYQYLHGRLPKGLNGFITIIRYWPCSLFYIMAECWSTIMLSVLLWGFVVDVIKVKEAKRFYGLFGMGRNIAGIAAGKLGIYFSQAMHNIKNSANADANWNQTLLMFSLTIIISCFLIMIIYKYMHKYVFPERYLMGGTIANKGKQKISLKESILYVLKSKYVLYISILILAYNVVINLTEVLWKGQIKELYPNSAQYTSYMSSVTYYTGWIATIFSGILSSNIIRRLGWRVAAMITPISLALSGLGFFYFLFVKQFDLTFGIIMGVSPLILTTFFGSLQNCFGRAFKYTIFDDTKEMTLIPLSPEEKLKAKAAIDGIGSRLGKSGSSLLLQIMYLLSFTTASGSPFIFIVMLVLISLWMLVINSLAKSFAAKTDEAEPAKTEEVQA